MAILDYECLQHDLTVLGHLPAYTLKIQPWPRALQKHEEAMVSIGEWILRVRQRTMKHEPYYDGPWAISATHPGNTYNNITIRLLLWPPGSHPLPLLFPQRGPETYERSTSTVFVTIAWIHSSPLVCPQLSADTPYPDATAPCIRRTYEMGIP